MLSLIDRHRIDECRLLKRPREAVNILAIRGVQRQQVFLSRKALRRFFRVFCEFRDYSIETRENTEYTKALTDHRVTPTETKKGHPGSGGPFPLQLRVTRLLPRSYRNEH